MKVVIDIPEDDYNAIRDNIKAYSLADMLFGAVQCGTVLPEEHGDLIDREEFLKSFLDSFWSAVEEGNSSFEIVGAVKNIIRNTSTVIAADKENKE